MSDAARPGKRKWRRWLGAAALAVCVLVVGGVIGLRLYYNDTRLTALIQHLVAEQVPFPVEIGNVHLSLLSGIEISHVRVGPPNAAYKDDVATVERVTLHYTLAPLFARRLDIRAITVIDPRVTLEMQNGVWNVAALASAFPQAASQPVKVQSASGELPVAITLEHFEVSGVSARIDAPDMSAQIEGLSVSANAALAGRSGHGSVVSRIDRDFSFARTGLGRASGHLTMTIDAEAPSIQGGDLSWNIEVSHLQGALAGVSLPALPLTLRGKAHANVITQTVEKVSCELALGEALHIRFKADVHDAFGDPLIDITALEFHAVITELLALVPHPPVQARGVVDITGSVHGRLSDLQQLRNFTADTTVKWQGLSAEHPQGALAEAKGELSVHVAQNIALTLEVHSAGATSRAARANDIDMHADLTAPLSVLAQKLDQPLGAVLRMHVGGTDAQGQHAREISLTAHAEVFDLAGRHTKAAVVLDVGEVSGLSAPVHVDIAAERNGAAISIDHALVALGDLLSVRVEGKAAQTANGAKVDLHAAMPEIDLAALLAAAPTHALAVKGKLAAEVTVKGDVPFDLARQLSVDPLTLLAHVTPFELTLATTWRELGFSQPGVIAAGACGSLRVKTGPHTAAVRVDGDVGHAEAAGTTLDGVRYALSLDDHAGEVALTLHTAVAMVRRPDVLPLEETTFDTAVTFARDAELRSLVLTVPSLGTRITAEGRLLHADTFLREQQWTDSALKGVHASGGVHVALAAPTQLQPLPGQPLSVIGALTLAADAAIDGGLAKLTGVLSTHALSIASGDARLTDMTGTLPFTQTVKLGDSPRPVWSDTDIFKQKPRIAYYDELRSYGRDAAGLTIAQLKQGRFAIDRIAFNGRFADGLLLIDHFGASLLAGDVAGQLALQFGADKTFRLALASTFSNVDFSVLSKTKPGPDSQVNGNLSLDFSWGERVRNVDGAFNLTRLGRELLVKALLALDPDDKDAKLRANRQALQRYQITIDLLQAWIKDNNVNANLFYSLILTKLTLGLYKPINNDLVRRLNLGPRLDAAAPQLDPILGPLLGWSQARAGVAP